MRMSDSIKNIAVALVKAQSEMGVVVKGADNPFYKSKYADINDVIKTIKEVLNNNGIAFLQPIAVKDVAGEKVNLVETMLLHTSGEYLIGEIEVILKDKDPQKMGMSVTYSRRFGLQSMVGLPSEDDDGNTASGKEDKTKSDKPSRFTRTKKTEKVEEVESSNEVEEKETTVESKVEQEEKPTPSKTSFRRFTRGNK